MTESEIQVRSIASEIVGMRNAGGTTASTLMFGLLALLYSKNKITNKDIEVIFEVEKRALRNTVKDYFEKNFGGIIQSEQEIEEVYKFCNEYIENMKSSIISASEELRPKRKKRNGEENGI